jgi:DNA-binding transcriptional regulator YdaS (Cro superfamily)
MTNEPTPYEALLACERSAGSQSALARSLGVAQPTVWRWLQSSRKMPAQYVLKAEALYGVSRHALRPDIYPREMDFAPSPSAIGEPYYECGPILSARAQSRHGNRSDIVASGGVA